MSYGGPVAASESGPIGPQVATDAVRDGVARRRAAHPDEPRYASLAAAVEDAISSGVLADGAKLPAERDLVAALRLSRTTVSRAYARLEQGGWLERRVGSGTFARRPDPQAGRVWLRDVIDGAPRRRGARRTGMINLTSSRPFVLGAGLRDALGRSAEAVEAVAEQLQYATQGLPELRETVAAAYTARGLPTTAEQVLITSGAQQALGLVLQLYVRPDDPVAVESPTYHGALDALRVRQARPVAIDADPATVADQLAAVAEHVPLRAAYLMTTCHAVTGRVVGAAQRRALAELSLERQLPLIEDDILAGLTFAEGPATAEPPPVAAYAEDAPIFTIGSTSKLVWNGLRVGWLRAPEALLVRLARLKGTADLGTSLVAQLVAGQLLVHADDLARRRREENAAAFAHAATLLERHLPAWRWTPPEGGRSLWVRLPEDGPDGPAVAQAAVRHGVSVIAGPTFAADGRHRHRLRLMPVRPPDRLAEGVARLSAAWDELQGP
jgi:DNA-binding transcriptional MocR family regulator